MVQQAKYAPSVYLTAANLAQYPGPDVAKRYAFVKSLNRIFAWAAGDATAADNVSVIAPSGGSAGRWLRVTSTTEGFYTTTPIAKQTVTGSRGGNAALADLLTKLANLGLITDGTS
jgi:hypothetical protein